MATKVRIYVQLAQLIGAIVRCGDDKKEWRDKHTATVEELVKSHFPRGSGFDSGTTLDFDHSTEERLVFHTSFHHMNEGGMYDGWTEHTIIVKPSLAFGFKLRIGGTNRNQIKDVIAQDFEYALNTQIGDEKQDPTPVAKEPECTCPDGGGAMNAHEYGCPKL